MNWRKLRFLCAALLALALNPSVLHAQSAANDYRVGPRDLLAVTIWGHPELSGKFSVSANGQLALPLIGAVPVGGLTVAGIEAELTARYADGYLRRPQVDVEVAEYLSQRVFVIGEVRTPGAITLTGSTTLLEALAHAVLTEQAGGQVLLLRPKSKEAATGPVVPDQEGVMEIGRFSVENLRSGGLSANVALQDGDTIFVPRVQTVFVLGQVNKPGVYTIESDMTVQTAISMAGGTTQLGSTGRVRIVRVVNGERVEERAKLDDLVKPGDTITVGSRLF